MTGLLGRALTILLLGCINGLYLPHAVLAGSATCSLPLQATNEWKITSLENAKLDEQTLCALNKVLDKSPEMNVHAVVVIRGGNLVFETYRKGDDENWGTKFEQVTHTAQMLHDVRSVSKSIVSLLIGIALDRKLIASIDEPIFSFFPEYSDIRTEEKDRIQLRHLLTMTAGLDANEDISYESPLNTERIIYQSPDPYRAVLEREVRRMPGEVWNYNSGCTMLLGAVLQKVTGKSLIDFANEALFEPLGITNFYWTRLANSREPAAGAGLRLRPRDMAKIGELLINEGVWNGRRIVSKEWIDQSVQPLYPVTWNSNRYGFHWWVGRSTVGKKVFQWTAAWGLGGQRLFIIPESKLVVAINAGLYNSQIQAAVPIDILENFVLAAVQD